MARLTAISLFTGGMGLDLGFDHEGFQIKVAVENDRWAIKTIEANRPGQPVIGRPIEDVPTEEILDKAADLTQAPRYNIAPTQMALTVTSGDGRHASYMRWGLIPSLAKSDSVGSRMINARAETVAERPSFRNSLQHRRCLVLADGFYEWQRTGKVRRPIRRDRQILHDHNNEGQRPPKPNPQQDAGDPSQGAGGVLAGCRGT